MAKNIVFRALNEEQAIAAEKGEPIVARDPEGHIPIAWHVRGKRLEESQYISTTKKIHCLFTKDTKICRDVRTSGAAIIAIDLDAVEAKGIVTIDLTEDETLNAAGFSEKEHARNWAKSSKEVIIEGEIPADCYFLIMPAGMIQQINLFMQLKWTEKYGDYAQKKCAESYIGIFPAKDKTEEKTILRSLVNQLDMQLGNDLQQPPINRILSVLELIWTIEYYSNKIGITAWWYASVLG